jgi:multidrug efflux pump subunit AcrB
MGHSPVQAAMLGTREVAWPITTSTLTTLAAFAPLLLWPGIMGEFFSYLPITLIVCLSSSLFVALIINPAVCAALMRVRKGQKWGDEGRQLGPFMRRYEKLLRTAVRWKWTTLVLSFVLLVGMIAAYFSQNLGVEFMPKTDPQNASVDVTFPEGSRIEKTRDLAYAIDRTVTELPNAGDVEAMTTSVGTRGVTELFGSANAPNISRIAMEFTDMEDRAGNSAEFIESIRRRLADVAGAEVRVRKQELGPPVGDPVNIEIHGSDYKLLGELAARVKKIIPSVPGVVDIRDDFEPGRPELEITVNRKRAALLGLSPFETGTTLQTAYRGTKVGVIRMGDEEYDVRVIADEESRQGFGMLDKLYLATQTGGLVPASTVADWRIRGGQGSIKKIDRDLVVTVTSDVAKGYINDVVRKEVQAALREFEASLPPGYFITLTGEQEMMEEAEAFLGKAFLIALFLIAMILISQFNSVRLPFIIITSVVLSLFGVFMGLMVLRMPFIVMMTGIGVISLAGVVVNNAIVLIDYINKLRERGLTPFEAVVEGGMTRLRPVLLTAVTTIFGLIPMAIGLSFDFHTFRFATGKEMAQFWSPMATAVIFGLGVATVLTLVVVPSLYAILMRVRAPRPEGPDLEPAGGDGDDGSGEPALSPPSDGLPGFGERFPSTEVETDGLEEMDDLPDRGAGEDRTSPFPAIEGVENGEGESDSVTGDQ